MTVKNSSSMGRRHDRGGEDSVVPGLHAVWLLVWESRCTHPPVRVTHPPWEGLGWEENCVPPRRAVSRVLLLGEERPSVPRGRRMSQREGGEAVFSACSGRKCLPAPSGHPLLRWSIFLVEKAIFTAAADTERVLGTQLLRKLPGQVLAPWAPNSSASLVCTLPPSTRPRLLKFLRSANFRPTMLLKK